MHRVRGPTIPALPSPANRAGQLSTRWPSPPGSADRLLGDLLWHGISHKVASLFGKPSKGELCCMINRKESVLYRQAFGMAKVPQFTQQLQRRLLVV
jgi:hypothetical protein